MNTLKKDRNGFSIVELLLIFVLLAVISFASYMVYHSKQNSTDTNFTAQDEQNTQENTANNRSVCYDTSQPNLVQKDVDYQFNDPVVLQCDSSKWTLFTQYNGATDGNQATGLASSSGKVTIELPVSTNNTSLNPTSNKKYEDKNASVCFYYSVEPTSLKNDRFTNQLYLVKVKRTFSTSSTGTAFAPIFNMYITDSKPSEGGDKGTTCAEVQMYKSGIGDGLYYQKDEVLFSYFGAEYKDKTVTNETLSSDVFNDTEMLDAANILKTARYR